MTLRTQLKDPVFRKWFATPPKEKATAAKSAPWYLYVQKIEGGPWQRAEVQSYVQGYKFIAKNISKFHDMALSHKRTQFQPPVVRDAQTGRRKHHLPDAAGVWCPFCRRMTRFRYFARHHAMPSWANPDDRRCSICGVRQKFIRRFT